MKTAGNRKRNMHFQTKVLIVSVLIVCVMAGAIGSFWYRQTSKQAQSSAERYIGSVLERLNGSFETMLRDVDHLVICASIDTNHIVNPLRNYKTAAPSEKLACNQTILDTMLSLYQFKTYLEGMMISSVDGNYFRIGTTLPYQTLIQQPWFYEVSMDGKKSAVILPYSNGSEMVLSIARNIYSGSEQLGVVKADVRYTILNDCYGKDFNGLGAIYIIDPVSERIIYPLDVPQQIGAQLLTSGGQGEASGSGYAEIDGVSSLVIYQRSELTGWLTLGVVPESDVTREFRSVSLTAMAVSLLFGVVAVAFLAVFLFGETAKIQKLCTAVAQIGGQNLQMQPVIHSGDEIETLQNQIIYMVDRIRNLLYDIQCAEQTRHKLEFQILQNQINPHFLYNTLSAINWRAKMRGAQEISDMVEALSNLLRVTLNDDSGLIPLEQELSLVQSYIVIQRIRFDETLDYRLAVEADELKDVLIPKLTLQPLIENAIRYGLEQSTQICRVQLSVRRQGAQLVLLVQNDGSLYEDDLLEKLRQKTVTPHGYGIGLLNIEKRLEFAFGKEAGLELYNEDGMATARITIPCRVS